MQDGNPRKPLSGKVAIVTGAGRGLGEAVCHTLAAAGASVVPADLRTDLAEKVAMEAQVAGGQSMSLRLDVSDEDQAQQAIETTYAKFGRVDIVVNNAAVDVTLPVEELTVSDWDHILGVNLRGPFLMSKFAFPIMREQCSGHIVNVVPAMSRDMDAGGGAYQASRWGLLGFSHAPHVEGRKHSVKVTALSSGGVRTQTVLERPGADLSTLQDPRNVAQAILFVLTLPEETVVPELTVLPMKDTSWP